jgi:hypothetical protein
VLPITRHVQASRVHGTNVDAIDELGRLRSVTPPPDLTGSAISTGAAVVLFPLIAAAAALALHPLTLAPRFLLPALAIPAITSVALARWRSQGAGAGLALAVAAAVSTVFYLCLFAAVLAVARIVGALVIGG